VGFSSYLGYFLPLSQGSIKALAIGSIVLLTVMNCFGVKLGARVQNGFTFLKLAILGLLAVPGLITGTLSNLISVGRSWPLSNWAGPFGLAMVAVLWSYDGWIEITYVASEVKNPQKNIPRSLLLSTALAVLIYIIVNLVYFSLLPVDVLSGSKLVASDAFAAVFGPAGAGMAAVAVMIATLGCNNGMVLSSPRIYYAMASERVFFKSLAHIHPRFRTPIASLVAQGIWASLLILTGTFNQLITYVVFASWIFYAMSAAAVMILRKKSSQLLRPYRVWGYPFTPIIFIIFSLFLVSNALIKDPRDSAFGLGIIALGLPAYFYWRREHEKAIISSPKEDSRRD